MDSGWLVEDGFSLRKLPAGQQVPVILKTEWAFRNRLSFPSAEEQFKMYIECSSLGSWAPLIFSLFDFSSPPGREESLLATDLQKFRDFNGFPLWKNFPLLFESQIKAFLQSSYFRKCWVLLPSLRAGTELKAVQVAVMKIMEELNARRVPFDRYLKIGVGIDNPFSLRNIQGLLGGDFLIFDFDSIFSHLLGVAPRSLQLPEFLELIKGEVETILRWLEAIPFCEKWCGFISFLPPSKWGSLGELPWEAYFQRVFPENE
ncbi:MAG: hypothetical protein NUV68_06005 [Caldiserica bacterium]|jgi:hypothetical protein|nr:hypothetical protein [Caldisericota bacterium]MDH7562879.1 hypothetical protein [Caldisericota bacterium]